MTFITPQSYKCLLGVQSKNILERDQIFSWTVGKKQHFSTCRNLQINDLSLLQSLAPSNFHYLNQNNLDFLKTHFKVDRSKSTSIILDINDLTFSGNQFKNVRHCLNKCGKNELSLEANFRKLEDVKKLIEEWSNDYTAKYFRDFSGKNYFFYKNNFHQDLINLFVYHQNDLIAFGTLSQPVDGISSYVIGKALYKRMYGLSEFADVELYKLGQVAGVSQINMGRAPGKLLDYKTKFKHTKEITYDGSIEIKI